MCYLDSHRWHILLTHWALTVTFTILILGCSNSNDSGIHYWVSIDGDDSSSGSLSHPFQTVHRARDAVRSLTEQEKCKGVTINMLEGTHQMIQPLLLDSRDSGCAGKPIVYRAASAQQVVLSGGIKLADWEVHDSTLGIYKTELGTQYDSRQLFVNGQRATRARTSANPSGFRPAFSYVNGSPRPEGIEFIPSELNSDRWNTPSDWTNVSDIEAVLVTQWKMTIVPLQSVTPYPQHKTPSTFAPFPLLPSGGDTGLIKLQEPAWTNANLFVDRTSGQPGLWSFWQVTHFENAYQFLDQPGEWYLDRETGYLYYIPRLEEDIYSAEAYLPIQEVLIAGTGTAEQPLSNLTFEGLTFSHATWMGPSGAQGYVSDQSGFRLTGSDQSPVTIGHSAEVTRSPGNLMFKYAQNIVFRDNLFEHLGAVALDLDTGSQNITVENNVFTDISSAAIQLGGVSSVDARPSLESQYTQNNLISENIIASVGQEYFDAAGIYVGFTRDTQITHNTISDIPWSGIAVGWGWGLLDAGMFPGLPGAKRGEWGTYTTPTQNSGNQILYNRIEGFLSKVWDGGAIYTTGQQAISMDDALLIEGNVAHDKRPEAGGNTFYTDGGSRYIVLKGNASYNNPVGRLDFGPLAQLVDPLPYPPYALLDFIPYGNETGGCQTYGDILYEENYFSDYTFFSVCPFTENGVSYPTNLTYKNNTTITGEGQIPRDILEAAGAH